MSDPRPYGAAALPTRAQPGRARLFLELLRHPREAAGRIVVEGRPNDAALGIALACVIAALATARFAGATSVADLVYGPQRSPLVGTLLEAIGTARTAVVVYLLEQAWNAVLAVTAIGPLFVWLLGATAVHAAATLAGVGRPFRPFNLFAAYATAAALIPAGLIGLALEGEPRSAAAALGRLLGFALLVWLGSLYYQGIRAYYRVGPSRALTVLFIALTLFYFVPLAVIATAVVAIVAAAVALELA